MEGSRTGPPSYPAGSSSGSPSPGRWRPGPPSSSLTSPPATLTPAPRRRCWRRCVREFGQTVVMVTHDPVSASYSDRVVFLADGRLIGTLDDPEPESVID